MTQFVKLFVMTLCRNLPVSKPFDFNSPFNLMVDKRIHVS